MRRTGGCGTTSSSRRSACGCAIRRTAKVYGPCIRKTKGDHSRVIASEAKQSRFTCACARGWRLLRRAYARLAMTRSNTRVVDELLRRRLAPLRDERLLGRHQVRAVGEVEAVRVGPVLVHAAPRVGPVVVDLAAQHVPADAPHVLVLAALLQVVVAHADVV